MEEADKGWMMMRIYEYANVSSDTG